jgi:hypothetical protein
MAGERRRGIDGNNQQQISSSRFQVVTYMSGINGIFSKDGSIIDPVSLMDE